MAARPPHLHTTCQILKSLFGGLSKVQSCIKSRWSRNTLFCQDCNLEKTPVMGTVGTTYILRTGEGVRSSDCLGPAQGSTGSHFPLMTSTSKMLRNSLLVKDTDSDTILPFFPALHYAS